MSQQKKGNFESKQRIEQLYFETQEEDCKWYLISSDSIKTTYGKNLKRMAPYIILSKELSFYLINWLGYFELNLKRFQYLSLADSLQETAKTLELSYSDVIAMFNHSLWHSYIETDLNIEMDLYSQTSELKLEVNYASN